MPRFDQAVNSFSAGEASPRLWARAELPEYQQSAKEIYNSIVYLQGGVYRRPGTRSLKVYDSTNGQAAGYVSSGTWSNLTSANSMRCFPLAMSDGRKYVICITAGAPAPLGSSNNSQWAVLDVTNADQGIANSVLSQVGVGSDFGQMGFYDFNYRGYTESDLTTIQFAQIGDFLVLTCPNQPPVFFFRNVPGSPFCDPILSPFISPPPPDKQTFAARTLDKMLSIGSDQYAGYCNVFPFRDANISNARNQGSLQIASGTIGVTTTMTSSAGIFLAGHAGTYFKLSSGGSTGYVLVNGVTSATTAQVTPVTACTTSAVGITSGTSWEERAWSNARGWPRAVCGFQQRIYYAGNAAQPDTVWGTQQGNIFVGLARKFEQDPAFTTAITNDRPFQFTIAATEPNVIQWMSAGKSLFIGSLGREFVAAGSNGSLGPLDIGVSAESAYGSVAVQPIRYDSCLYYIQRSGQAVRELVFNYMESAYKGQNIFLRSEHLVRKAAAQHAQFLRPQINRFAVQMNENPVIWMTDNNGGLISAVVERDSNITAFSYHEMGGNLLGEIPKVQDICSLPSVVGNNDYLFMPVKRTINGTQIISLEYLGHEFALDSLLNSSTSYDDKMIYADCARMVQVSTATTTFPGFTNLLGATVDVIADGNYIGRFAVGTDAAGTLTLPAPYKEVIAGLPYISRITLLDAEPQSPVGSSIGQNKKINAVTMRFYRTVSAKVGRDANMLEAVTFPSPGINSCDIRKQIVLGYARGTQVMIVQDQPLPFSLSGVVSEGTSNA